MNKRFFLLGLVAASIAVFWWLDLDQYLTLSYLQNQHHQFESWYQKNPVPVIVAYAIIYVVVTGLSLPGAAVLTLAGGALLGFWVGLVVVSFASTIGATIAFLIARLLLRDWVQQRFGDSLKAINRGVERDGGFYLFTLRLVPVFPFFVINLAMALTPIKTWLFYWVSQLGMLAGTAIYVNAGTQLVQIETLADILSFELLISFALLGVFPWLAKATLSWLQTRRKLMGFKKPEKFDANLIVIGAGSGGLVSAYIAAAVKAKVILIEENKMGGDCLNTGCVPSKALIRSSRIAQYVKRVEEFGLKADNAQVDFPAVMQRVRDVIKAVAPHDSVERYSELGVDCIQGRAKIISPWEVEVNNQRLAARKLIVASGGRPQIPSIPGLGAINYFTSDTIWQLQDLPKRLLVIGGGPIACELAQAFQRLGSQVTMAVRSKVLPREDSDAAKLVKKQLRNDGVELLTKQQFVEFGEADNEAYLLVEGKKGQQKIIFDEVLVAAGRSANTQNLGLETVGIELNKNGTVAVDERMRSQCPTVYACGDAAGPYQFTHVASHQAWYATVNALFGFIKTFKVDYSVIPWVTFCDPEVARVGLNEKEADDKGVAYEITTYDLNDLDRAIADSEARGFVKVLTVPGKDKILGVTIVAYHASELIAEYVLAMKQGLGLNKILGTIHVYPTLSEANKYAAGVWKKNHQPVSVLKWVEKLHRYLRR
jgi:pyruvate/2-oxoglutarate dehydrogenase complex dihydrolipoamide dehydrogenase (E3) component/uncharacterized membrane protein YdjX (TVP38/TMEM64 family)